MAWLCDPMLHHGKNVNATLYLRARTPGDIENLGWDDVAFACCTDHFDHALSYVEERKKPEQVVIVRRVN